MKKIMFLSLLVLAACSTPEERGQGEINACIKQGYAEGSPEFDNCRLQLHEAAEERKAQRMGAFDAMQQLDSNRHVRP